MIYLVLSNGILELQKGGYRTREGIEHIQGQKAREG